MDVDVDFRFKGKTIEELQKLSLKEFALLANSRAKRNLLRNENDPFYQRLEKGLQNHKTIRTHKRDMVVTPKMVFKSIYVYNGKNFIQVDIMPEMLGHYLGEFVLTRKRLIHGKAGIGATKSSTAISERK